MEAETEVMTPHPRHKKLKETKNGVSTSFQRKSIPDLDLGSEKPILDFQSPEL